MEKRMKKMKWKNKQVTLGMILLGIFLLMAVFVPICSGYSYTAIDADIQNQGGSWQHLFGTDKFGRDIFVRVWYGVRISLAAGIGSALLNGCIGICCGAISGYLGGKTDMILMRLGDVVSSIPSLIYVILIMMTFGSNVGSLLLGLCISGWVDTARLVRGEILKLKELEYCIAARLAGGKMGRILWKHLIPNAAGPIIVNLTFLIPQAIFTESFLSFVGVGIEAPAASLGTLIRSAMSQMQVYPGQLLYPTMILCVLILAMHLVGHGLEMEVNSQKEGFSLE